MEEKDFFITTWVTTKDNQTIVMPISADLDGYSVDWGDGGKSRPNETGATRHTYKKAGTYKVKVTGKRLRISFANSRYENQGAIKSVDQWGAIKWTTMSRAFKNCRNLQINATDTPDLSQVTSMHAMFENTNFSADLTNWDVTNVTSMSYLFASSSFNGDISTWNVKNVKDMSIMFWHAEKFNNDISGWNVSNVENMSSMFTNAPVFNQNLNNWDVSNVKTIRHMFTGASSFNSNLDKWAKKLGKVTDMSGLFERASSFKGNISNWDVSNVTNMSEMFRSTRSFNGDISGWNVRNVTNMKGMFFEAVAFNQDLSKWGEKTLKVTDMGFMFRGATVFNGNISEWNVSNVTDMSYMFSDTNSFNANIENWDVSNVTNMNYMFSNAFDFNQSLNKWGDKLGKVKNLNGMFYNAISFNGNIQDWDVSNVENMSNMFNRARSFNQDLSKWGKKLGKLKTTSSMFTQAVSFNGNIDNWDVSNVIDMSYMFSQASSFSRDISNWNVGNVTQMRYMFEGVKLSQKNYDKLLTSWSKLTLKENVIFSAGSSNYCKASDARSTLVNKFKWSITDNGQACTGVIDINKSEILAIPNNVPILKSNRLVSRRGLGSRIIIQAKGTDGLPLTFGGEPIKINASFGAVSNTIDHGNGTYSALVFSTRPGVAQISFTVAKQTNSQNIQVNFKRLTGCEVNFNVKANQPIIQAEGRYRLLIQKPKIIIPIPRNSEINIKPLAEGSNSESNWVNFNVKDPKNPTTPQINEPGKYDLQVKVKGRKDDWTKWYALPPFTVNLCRPINSLAIPINRGRCFTPIKYTDTVYVDRNRFKGKITEGLVLYNDFYLSSPYDGRDEFYVIKPLVVATSEKLINPTIEAQDFEEGIDPYYSIEFNISRQGVVQNISACESSGC